jgi:hypothetical protein
MKRQKVKSQAIESVGYEPDTETLEIEFKGRGDKPGNVHQYPGFPAAEWAKFQAASSIGSHFAQFIRGKYESFKVENRNSPKDGVSAA